jgi:hypothetical protein
MALLYSPHPFTKESKQQAIKSLPENTTYDQGYLNIAGTVVASVFVFGLFSIGKEYRAGESAGTATK